MGSLRLAFARLETPDVLPSQILIKRYGIMGDIVTPYSMYLILFGATRFSSSRCQRQMLDVMCLYRDSSNIAKLLDYEPRKVGSLEQTFKMVPESYCTADDIDIGQTTFKQSTSHFTARKAGSYSVLG